MTDAEAEAIRTELASARAARREAKGSLQLQLPYNLITWLAHSEAGPYGQLRPTMTVWLDGDSERWFGVLHNRACGVTLFRSAECLAELTEALARGLLAEPAGWKPDRPR